VPELVLESADLPEPEPEPEPESDLESEVLPSAALASLFTAAGATDSAGLGAAGFGFRGGGFVSTDITTCSQPARVGQCLRIKSAERLAASAHSVHVVFVFDEQRNHVVVIDIRHNHLDFFTQLQRTTNGE